MVCDMTITGPSSKSPRKLLIILLAVELVIAIFVGQNGLLHRRNFDRAFFAWYQNRTPENQADLDMAGSPAETAGLRAGDFILQVDGVATSGRKLVQNVESIRGFSAGSVTLTVQRTRSTNLQCVIHRSSWKNLGISQ